MMDLQENAVYKLIHAWKNNVELLFLDECTCHPWRKQIKVWMLREKPFQLNLAPDKKGLRGSVAVLGAISNKQNELKIVVSNLGNRHQTF